MRAWHGDAACPADHQVAVTFTFSDYGDAPAIYQCSECSDLVAVDPEAEHYVGPAWDHLRDDLACPSCGDRLSHAWLYPDHFRCPECSQVGSFDVPEAQPDDELRTVVTCWDPYASPR